MTTVTDFDFSENKLVHVPHQALEQPVDHFDYTDVDYRQAVVDHMWDKMVKHKGIGLAANQINLNAAIFVMKNDGEQLAVINPHILETSAETCLMTEGCLSDPGLYLKVKRPSSIRAMWETIEGETVINELYGLNARVFLHEFDHLSGVLFTDRVGRVKLEAGRKKQKKTLQNYL